MKSLHFFQHHKKVFFAHALPITTVLALLFLAGCKHPAPGESTADEPVITGDTISFSTSSPTLQRLQTMPVVDAQQKIINLPGRIAWDEDHTSRLMPPVAGKFLRATEQGALGAAVKANQVLGYLVSPDIGSAQSEHAAAEAAFVQAQKNSTRLKELFEVHGVSAKELEQGESDLQRAHAEADRTALRLASLGASADSVDLQFAIRSPIDGVVVERNTNPGLEWRPDQPGAAVFTISNPDYLWCWIDAPESALPLLHTGQKINLRSSAWPGELYKAQVDYVGDALDPTTRTIKVRAHLHNNDRHLKGEMYVTAELGGQAKGTFDVPSMAVFLNQHVQQVFVKTAPGSFVRKTILPVYSNDQWVSITEGLNKGDEVVVDGALYLEKLLEEAARSSSISAVTPDKPDNATN